MKKLLLRSAFFLVSTLLALVVIEVVFRVMHIETPVYQPRRVILVRGDTEVEGSERDEFKLQRRTEPVDPDGIRTEYLPGITFRWCYDVEGDEGRPYFDASGCVSAEINADGIRGPAVPHAKPTDERRIAVVGDSFTFGHGVRFEDTYAQGLERRLNEEGESEASFRTVNLGVQGYDVRDVYFYVRDKAPIFDPDWILYGFFLNDVFVGSDLGGAFATKDLKEKANGEATGLARHSKAFEFATRTWARRRLAKATAQIYNQGFAEEAEPWQKTKQHILRMRDAAKEQDAELVVAVFPELVGLEGAYPFEEVHARIGDFCAENGIRFVDLLEAFRGRVASDLWVHFTDHHPNEIAHDIAAEALFEALRADVLK